MPYSMELTYSEEDLLMLQYAAVQMLPCTFLVLTVNYILITVLQGYVTLGLVWYGLVGYVENR